MLEITNLHADIEGRDILKGLTLTVPTGQIHAIMGPNGAGKSTLSYILAGRPGYNVSQGNVKLDGQDLLPMPPEERWLKNTGRFKINSLEEKFRDAGFRIEHKEGQECDLRTSILVACPALFSRNDKANKLLLHRAKWLIDQIGRAHV